MATGVLQVGLPQSLQRFRVDSTLLALLVLLTGIGFFTLYGVVGDDTAMLTRHAARLVVGFGLFFLFAAIPIHAYRSWGVILYALSIILLLLVLGIGEISKGAQRWLDIWLVRFQPSEILKIATPLLLCSILASQLGRPSNRKVLWSLAIIALPVLLVSLQPDLGTALLIAANGLIILFLAGLSWYWIAGLSISVAIAMPIAWHLLHDYQRQRALSFLNPESDPLGTGYHLIQSKIAIGSGGLWGKGWDNSSQAALGFIPEYATDFIFTSYAEQTGFAGVCILILLYVLLFVKGISISMNAVDNFSRLFAGSFIVSFMFYFLVNIAMVSGLLPVVGVTLPLMSYGGTSIAILLSAFGILAAIAKYRPMMGRSL